MKVSMENDNNFGYEKITILVDCMIKNKYKEWYLTLSVECFKHGINRLLLILIILTINIIISQVLCVFWLLYVNRLKFIILNEFYTIKKKFLWNF